ncbi:MAG TPA: signal peptidase I [Acidobacteriaceae bacterium]|nr:signal peptidase I [Acidobacteriaceae bacterium]
MDENGQQTNVETVRDEAMPAPPGVATPRQMKLMKQWFRDVMISVAVAWFIIMFLYQPVKVQGTSMAPRLADQDRLFINKFVYRIGDVKRGDVVVFLYPGDQTKSYIKRVIGLPGDDVRVDHGHVFVNGTALAEPYVAEQYQDDRSVNDVVIPAGDVYVMGDHRNISSDSRDFGPVPKKLIYGKAAYVYWPVKDSGSVQ